MGRPVSGVNLAGDDSSHPPTVHWSDSVVDRSFRLLWTIFGLLDSFWDYPLFQAI